ncbi:uncharacterized protein TRIADDRAFT_51607 [Trichoplax adhaerens]|uniref:Uncharacterized protein n=1 Tax=Trichoplax adhaerens TaxID=10228 RepID=B3RK33_TRIAD|nr:predicted protein [Trichoplax adhaerens]EDV28562.1 predicted protein [Trichoplax adhaerens]|eukprot:XP_002107764.1 predicted protein [Trichoplax adhaerens]
MTDRDDGRKNDHLRKDTTKCRRKRRPPLPPVDNLRSDGRSTSAGSSNGVDSRRTKAMTAQKDHDDELCQLMKKKLKVIDDWLYNYTNTTRDSIQINKETLRWEYETSNYITEKSRLEIYKEKRRQRYLDALGKSN